MKIVVLGAGAWGTAWPSARRAPERGHQVTLWARDAAQAAPCTGARENARYLPGMALAARLAGGSGGPVTLACPAADLVIVATPMAALRGMLRPCKAARMPVAWLCKGFRGGPPADRPFDRAAGHEVCAQVAPTLIAGVLSGPSFAQEVARGQPTALVAASEHAAVRERWSQAFHSPSCACTPTTTSWAWKWAAR
jgi:glycerol-3-phosphate dehydrogenase (NAD(P)+)